VSLPRQYLLVGYGGLYVYFRVSQLHFTAVYNPGCSIYLFCLSNAIQCMDLCVCVSVTLSVHSPTGQTPQWIFTVDILKDADLHNDVPFGGLVD